MADGQDTHGDAGALEALHPDAWRWAVHLTYGDRELAQDVLHDAYLAILDGKAKWRRKSTYKTFVFGVIRMTAKSVFRKRALMTFRFPTGKPHDMPAQARPDPLLRGTLQAMARLPKRQAELVQLLFAQDLTLEDAAQVMGISIGSARTHYARAKASLRDALNVEATDER